MPVNDATVQFTNVLLLTALHSVSSKGKKEKENLIETQITLICRFEIFGNLQLLKWT